MPLTQLAQLLQDNITKYVQQYFPEECQKAMEAESEDAQACLIHVKPPKNHLSVVITCKSKASALLLCRKVGTIPTRQGAFIGELQFQSRFHQLWKEDYTQKFQMLCLKDGTTGTVVHQESSQGPASSAASMRSAAADVLLRHQPQQQQAAQTQQQQDQQQQAQQQQAQQQQAQQQQAQQHLQQPQHQPSAHWHQQHQHSMWVQRTMLHYDHGQARNVHGNSSSSNELE
jgi:hypothetical protein